MTTYDAHVADSGTTITKTLHVGGVALGTLTGATFTVRVTNPSGVVENWTAGFTGGAAGLLTFVTPNSSYWDEVGTWEWLVRYTLGGVSQTCDPIVLTVGASGSVPGASTPRDRTDLVVIGDSLSTDPYELGPPYAPPAGTFAGWPDMIRKAGHSVTSIAVSGSITTQWLSTHLAAQFDPLVVTGIESPGAVFIMLGTNDLRGLLTAVQVETNIASMVAYILAACPWLSRVNVGTVLPYNDPPNEAARLAYNVWVRSQYTDIVPVEMALQCDPTSTGAMPAWMDAGDGIHPTATGGIQQLGIWALAGIQLSIDPE